VTNDPFWRLPDVPTFELSSPDLSEGMICPSGRDPASPAPAAARTAAKAPSAMRVFFMVSLT